MTLASTTANAEKWVTSWAGSVQGPYPVGNATAQPELRFAFPNSAAGAKDQTFRLVIKPDIWGRQMRLRFSNAYGTKPVTFDDAFAGLQMSGAAVAPGTNRPVTFGGKKSVTVPAGGQVWTDAVTLPWVGNPNAVELMGRKLSVSFHVAGETGPMTWHAKGLQTSYITAPDAGAVGELEDESAFPNTTTSWYFVDAVDAMAPTDTRMVVCFGDSITDGTSSTINGDDRWPDVLARRLMAAHERFSVVNAGIGGNQVVGPVEYTPAKPYSGGPSALSRLDRDVIQLSGVTHVIWMEGINDLSTDGGSTAEQVIQGYKDGVAKLRAKLPGVQVIGATLTSIVGTTSAAHKPPQVEQKRLVVNAFIRDNKGLFDGVVDFDAATRDGVNGPLRPEYVPGSSIGGPGEGLHPNHAGYLAMGNAVDLHLLTGPRARPVVKPLQNTPAKPAG
jgi:lysophospholipase L1-like esterase